MSMKRIETMEDLLKWSREINYNPMNNKICDYQDVYVHSQVETIDRLFIESLGNRSLIIRSVINCMSFDEAERLLKVLAHHKVSEQMKIEYEEFYKLENNLIAREKTFQESKKPIFKRINSLRLQIKHLQDRNDYLTTSLLNKDNRAHESEKRARQYQNKAKRYEIIVSMLSEQSEP